MVRYSAKTETMEVPMEQGEELIAPGSAVKVTEYFPFPDLLLTIQLPEKVEH